MITETEASQIIAEMMDSYNKPLSLIETQAWLDAMTKFPKSVVVEAWKRWTAGNKFFPLRDEWRQLAQQIQRELTGTNIKQNEPTMSAKEKECGGEILKFVSWAMTATKEMIIAKVNDGYFEKLVEKFPEYKNEIMDCKAVWVKKYNLKQEPKKELWFNKEPAEIPF